MTICHVRRAGFAAGEIHRRAHIDPWFLQQIKEIAEMQEELVKAGSLEALASPGLTQYRK